MINLNKINKTIKTIKTIKLNKLNKILFIILFSIVIGILLYILFFKQNNKNTVQKFNNILSSAADFDANIETIKNPYIKIDTSENTSENKSIDIIWLKQDSEFMKNNFPSTFDFDYDIKDDIIAKALTLPSNYCIIDCGAHIGDGSVAIAHALKYNNREDIIVYAIDPSKYKCDFIEFIKQKNNLNNLIVLNYGLSNVNNNYKSLQQSGNNTGAWNWVINENNNDNNNDNNDIENKDIINKFIKLDDLVKDNIIKHNIGIIHFDIEGMEKEALEGGIDTITKYKPYMSIENNNINKSYDSISEAN